MDLGPLASLALVLDTFPNCPIIQAQRYARFSCTQVILLTRLHFRDISSEPRRAFGFHILVTLVAAEAPSIPSSPQQLAAGQRCQPRLAFSERTRTLKAPVPFWAGRAAMGRPKTVPQPAHLVQDLQFPTMPRTIRSRNRPAKQVGSQRWLNQHSTNRGSTRQSVLCAVSASPECLMNRGELHRLRTGSPAHCPRPSGSGSTSSLPRRDFSPCRSNPLS